MTPAPDMAARILEVAERIRGLREGAGVSVEEMAALLGLTAAQYRSYESGEVDFPFTFIHYCAHHFGVEITEIMEGSGARLTSYTVTRKGGGQITAREDGILIKDLAPFFRKKTAEPYWVRYSYDARRQNAPIHLTSHSGQEFDLVLSGRLRIQVGDHTETLSEGDSIYYDSSTPHGMIAVDGSDCVFCAVVLHGDDEELADSAADTISAAAHSEKLISSRFVDTVEDENGALRAISFREPDSFNFAFDVVDALGAEKPDAPAMVHVDKYKNARRFTFADMSRHSARAANYFRSIGIKKGDKIMLVLKRHFEFWVAILGLHKIGAIAIPATHQLVEKDFEYRFKAAAVDGIICTADDGAAQKADSVMPLCPSVRFRMIVGGQLPGWRDFREEYLMFRGTFARPTGQAEACGDDPAIMFFTSGTTGYPKIAVHSYKYALGHYVTAKYWQRVQPGGLHFTISDTGWGKALWGKLYGQWLCESAVFVYDFDRFDANDILPMFAQYGITTFCAPPTMYRFMIKQDLSKFDLSTIKHAGTAGEALNPEVFHQFEKATGLRIREGFGQTETTLVIANLAGMRPKVGSMGKPNPLYEVDLLDADGVPVKAGETGEICIRTENYIPCGLYRGYYMDDGKTREAWHHGWYHTGDTAWRDEDGYYWYVGRVDDLIKSSGYRIGPFEIESVIMELPYVLECGVSAAPDETRGQVVKASIVLTPDARPGDDLAREIQSYVKRRTAPYKYPRVVVFRDELPKTISGKIIRNLL